MRRLIERMGRRSETAADTFEALALEWVRARSAELTIYESLLKDSAACTRRPGDGTVGILFQGADG